MIVALGDRAKDSVSGFVGVVIGKTEFLNGCTRVGLQPKVRKDGTLLAPSWFDEPQLRVLKPKTTKAGRRDTGGPMVSIPTKNMPG